MSAKILQTYGPDRTVFDNPVQIERTRYREDSELGVRRLLSERIAVVPTQSSCLPADCAVNQTVAAPVPIAATITPTGAVPSGPTTLAHEFNLRHGSKLGDDALLTIGAACAETET